MAMDKMRSISGSEVESVRIAKDNVSMLLRRIIQYKLSLESKEPNLLQCVATSVVCRVDRGSAVLGLLV